jgi:hypothetical protein
MCGVRTNRSTDVEEGKGTKSALDEGGRSGQDGSKQRGEDITYVL